MKRGMGRGVLRMEGGILSKESVRMVWGVGREEVIRIYGRLGKG